MKFTDLLKIDFLLLLPVLVLLTLGVLFIYSSGITSAGVQTSNEYVRQIIWASIGLIAALSLVLVNYRQFYNVSIYIYLISIIPLLYSIIFRGNVTAARWLRIGAFGFQASEFVKISVIILLARYLADTERDKNSFLRFFICGIIVIFPTILVLLQPDLGTALVYLAILLSMIFMAGIPMRYILFMVSCFILSGILLVMPLWQEHIYKNTIYAMAVLTNRRIVLIAVIFFILIAVIALIGFLNFKKKYFYWIVFASVIVILSLGTSYAARSVLRPYQLMRLIVFLDPQIDPRGAGWNIIQSETAIGAGGLTGRGYLQGTQSQYRFLPEQSTDFIFSIFSEEAGFIGGIFVFSLYILILMRLLSVMKITIDPFAKYFCAGLAGFIGYHFVVNVGMTMGVMPITGLPLIFMSYGGSSVLAGMIGIGIAESIFVRRYNRS